MTYLHNVAIVQVRPRAARRVLTDPQSEPCWQGSPTIYAWFPYSLLWLWAQVCTKSGIRPSVGLQMVPSSSGQLEIWEMEMAQVENTSTQSQAQYTWWFLVSTPFISNGVLHNSLMRQLTVPISACPLIYPLFLPHAVCETVSK